MAVELSDLEKTKILEAFAFDASMEEVAIYAGISRRTLFSFFVENPEFKERCLDVAHTPTLVARNTIVAQLKTNSEIAKWYLSRKRKQEFSDRIEHSGPDGAPLSITFDGAFKKDEPTS